MALQARQQHVHRASGAVLRSRRHGHVTGSRQRPLQRDLMTGRDQIGVNGTHRHLGRIVVRLDRDGHVRQVGLQLDPLQNVILAAHRSARVAEGGPRRRRNTVRILLAADIEPKAGVAQQWQPIGVDPVVSRVVDALGSLDGDPHGDAVRPDASGEVVVGRFQTGQVGCGRPLRFSGGGGLDEYCRRHRYGN